MEIRPTEISHRPIMRLRTLRQLLRQLRRITASRRLSNRRLASPRTASQRMARIIMERRTNRLWKAANLRRLFPSTASRRLPATITFGHLVTGTIRTSDITGSPEPGYWLRGWARYGLRPGGAMTTAFMFSITDTGVHTLDSMEASITATGIRAAAIMAPTGIMAGWLIIERSPI